MLFVSGVRHHLAGALPEGLGVSSGVNRAWIGGWPGSVTDTTTFMSGTDWKLPLPASAFSPLGSSFMLEVFLPASTVALPVAPLVATFASLLPLTYT